MLISLRRPFFKKSENFHVPSTDHQDEHQSYHDQTYHGTGGPLDTTYSATYGASHRHWHKTMLKLGVNTNRSHFSGSNIGCWTSITGVSPGKRERCYSTTAYYKPNAGRSNLVVLTEALIQEIQLEKEGNEWAARKVRFEYGGKEHIVDVSGEVVLCAGSVQSPQILELSGIGRRDVLEAAGIEVKVENTNVGENLQEHMSKHEAKCEIRSQDWAKTDWFISDSHDI